MADARSWVEGETEQFMDGTLIRRAARSQVILLICAVGLALASSRFTGLRRRLIVVGSLILGAGTAWSASLTFGLEQVRRIMRQIRPADGLVR